MAGLGDLLPGGYVPLPQPRPGLPFDERWSPVVQGQFEGLMRDRVYHGEPDWYPGRTGNWPMPSRQFMQETPGSYPNMPRDLHAWLLNLGLA